MLRFFQPNNRDNRSANIYLRIFILLNHDKPDYVDTLKTVSKDWKRAVEDYRDRIAIAINILSVCELFRNESVLSLVSTTRLTGGMTNKTVTFETTNQRYVARLPGKHTTLYINRSHEAYNARMADELGINAKLVFDKPNGIQVTKYLDKPEAMSHKMLQDERLIGLCMQTLRKLHTHPEPFKADLDVFQRNETMLGILRKHKDNIDEDYADFIKCSKEVESLLAAMKIVKVPCHNDTTPLNFILSNGDIKLIDWEYSNNNDPFWDFAVFLMEADFLAVLAMETNIERRDRTMLESYFGRYDPEHSHRLNLYKPIVEFYTVLWYEVQIVNKNYESDTMLSELRSMAAARRESGMRWLQSDEFKAAQLHFESVSTLELTSNHADRPLSRPM